MSTPTTSIIAVATDLLSPNPWNTNQMDATAYRKLRESIERVGSFKPVVVRELDDGEYQIIGGEHRWSVMNELGYEEIQVVNLGKISDTRAKQISVLDNERFGEDDEVAFQRLLEDIQSDLEYDLSDIMRVEFDLDKVMSLSSIDTDSLLDELDDELSDTPSRTKDAIADSDDKTMLRFRFDQDEAVVVRQAILDIIESQAIKTGNEFDDAGEALFFIINSWMTK